MIMATQVEVIDHGWNKIEKLLKIMDNSFVAVGFPGDVSSSNEPVGEGGSFTAASLAAVHEYGRRDDSIPSRPFMRQTFERNKKRIEKFQQKLRDKVIQRTLSVKMALSQLGEWYVKELKETIMNKGNFEPLKTRQGRPLFDTGTNLVDRIAYKVHIKR